MEKVLIELKKESFDRNPRLCRRVACSKCGHIGRRFLDFLRDNQFEVGKTEKILVAQPGQYALFTYDEETVTQVLIRVVCQKCGHEEVVSDPVLTVEYLTGICKCTRPRITYV